MSWISRLFRSTDRTAEAMDRTAVAANRIADLFERAADRLEERFALPEASAPALAESNSEPEETKRGRKARTAVN